MTKHRSSLLASSPPRPPVSALALFFALGLAACSSPSEPVDELAAEPESPTVGSSAEPTAEPAHEEASTSASEDVEAASARLGVALGTLAGELELTRVEDLTAASLPPLPPGATLESGVFERRGERYGLVLVRYANARYAAPHLADIERASEELRCVGLGHDGEVLKVCGLGEADVRGLSSDARTQLRWVR